MLIELSNGVGAGRRRGLVRFPCDVYTLRVRLVSTEPVGDVSESRAASRPKSSFQSLEDTPPIPILQSASACARQYVLRRTKVWYCSRPQRMKSETRSRRAHDIRAESLPFYEPHVPFE